MKWTNEPNEVRFQHNGIDCLVLRHPTMKHLCGYCCIPQGHPHHGLHYDNLQYDVHGGLTYSDQDAPLQPKIDGQWWIGFDTAHYMDLVPNLASSFSDGGVYRTVEYVTDECKRLADQIVGAA